MELVAWVSSAIEAIVEVHVDRLGCIKTISSGHSHSIPTTPGCNATLDTTPVKLDVLYEDNHLLIVNKPVGLPTMGVAANKPSLLTLAKDYVREKYNKPGNVYLGIVSRLDAPVSGVVLLARTSKAAARLTKQFKERSVDKVYWALVEPGFYPEQGARIDWVRHDERHRRVHLTEPNTPGGKEARLEFRRIRTVPRAALVEVRLLTGRKHQIRVQLAGMEFPVLGDRKYGSRRAFTAGIALHGKRLTFDHPVGGRRVEISAPLPPAWLAFGVG